MNKDILRRQILKQRDLLPESKVMEKSAVIIDMFCEKYSYLTTFLLYYPLGKEVSTINLIKKLNALEKHIYLPVVCGDKMEFRKFETFECLKKGRFGIYEPAGKLLDAVPDIMCVPGVVFDEECNRIGYGGGFYDKYLSAGGTFIKSALAYDFQVVDKIETECFDIPVDEIFTDKRVISRRI